MRRIHMRRVIKSGAQSGEALNRAKTVSKGSRFLSVTARCELETGNTNNSRTVSKETRQQAITAVQHDVGLLYYKNATSQNFN